MRSICHYYRIDTCTEIAIYSACCTIYPDISVCAASVRCRSGKSAITLIETAVINFGKGYLNERGGTDIDLSRVYTAVIVGDSGMIGTCTKAGRVIAIGGSRATPYISVWACTTLTIYSDRTCTLTRTTRCNAIQHSKTKLQRLR
jgi:hypothetical protein